MIDADEITYRCPDCRDSGFVYVPDPYPGYEAHAAARPCRSCDRGTALEAGRWYKRVYRRNAHGKAALDELQLKKFQWWLTEIHPVSADRIKGAFDRIVEREKAQR